MLMRPGKVGEVVVRPFGKGVRSASLERQGGEFGVEPCRVVMPQSKINEVSDKIRVRGAHSLMARRTFSFHTTADDNHARALRRPSAVLQQHQPPSSTVAACPLGALAGHPPPAPIAAVVLDNLSTASPPNATTCRPPPLPRLNLDGVNRTSGLPPAGQLAPPGSTPPPSLRGDDSMRSTNLLSSLSPLPILGPPLSTTEPCSDRSGFSRQCTPRFPVCTASGPEGGIMGGALAGGGSSARSAARSILRSPPCDGPSPQQKKVSFAKDCKPAPPASITDLLSFCDASS